MIGDTDDMQRRLRAMLPAGWFGDDTPVLDQLLQSLGAGFSAFWTLLQDVTAQSRIATAWGGFLDLIAADFFGAALVRFPDEQDDAFRSRIRETLLRPLGTRAAITSALVALTGQTPIIFEPARTSDTGGYTVGGIGFGMAGGWGSLILPFQFFITVVRPRGAGIANLAGYGSGGVPAYGNLALQETGISDSIIQAAVPPLLPVSTLAWMKIVDGVST
jgi:hypothetical protein